MGSCKSALFSALTTVEDFGQKVVKGGTKGAHEWEHPMASMDSHNICCDNYLQNVGMRSTTQCTPVSELDSDFVNTVQHLQSKRYS
jgi:hypothetical protein